jgi:hypothetical protein
MTLLDELPESTECFSCGMEPRDTCPQSQRVCGHHCNHIWTHENYHWCETWA